MVWSWTVVGCSCSVVKFRLQTLIRLLQEQHNGPSCPLVQVLFVSKRGLKNKQQMGEKHSCHECKTGAIPENLTVAGDLPSFDICF